MIRLWLPDEVTRFFQQYVRGEELLRADLRQVEASGLSLKDWKRALYMSVGDNATRRSVISMNLYSGALSSGWWVWESPSLRAIGDPSKYVNNQTIMDDLVSGATWSPYVGAYTSNAPGETHEASTMDLEDLLSHLAGLELGFGIDSDGLCGTLLCLRAYIDEQNRTGQTPGDAQLFKMGGKGSGGIRRRQFDATGRIKRLQSGRSHRRSATAYPGDRQIFGLVG